MKNNKSFDPKMIEKLESMLRDDQKVENLYQVTSTQKDAAFWQTYHEELNQKLSHKNIFAPSFSLLPVWVALAVACVIAIGLFFWQMKPKAVSVEVAAKQQELLKEWSALEEKGESLDLSEVLSNEELSEYMLAEYRTLTQLDQDFSASSVMPGR